MSVFTEIDQVIQKNFAVFKKPNVLTVRPGYKIKDHWITNQPAIVVTVAQKQADLSPGDAVPPMVGGYPTDVRPATGLQKMRSADPALQATVAATARPEFAQPEFPLERDIRTGQLLEKVPPAAPVAEMAAKPRVPYTPAPGVTLDPVTDTMSITCHASPEAGWTVLKKFLQDIQGQLTVGLYDFTSKHVLDTVKGALSGQQKLSLVLDHPQLNDTADQSDEETEAALDAVLGARQQFAWAAEARDPKVGQAIFPNAYHIKVAVKDHQSMWLSSGNWNNSNQPDIDPFGGSGDPDEIAKVAAKSDRDWHVVVKHPGLAQTFEVYLAHDLEVAKPLQLGAAAAPMAAMLPAAAAFSPEIPIPGDTPLGHYFPPFEIINEKVTVQPLLTPDSGAGNYAANILKLIQSAQSKLYIQTQYIHPPKAGTDNDFKALIDAVQAKINQGKEVCLILRDLPNTGGWLEKLQEAGLDMSRVKIQKGVHNKGFVVDAKIVALGSQNWSGDGVLRNRDASLIIYHEKAAQYFEKIFTHDWTTLAKQQLSFD